MLLGLLERVFKMRKIDLNYFKERLEQYDDAEYILDGLQNIDAQIISDAGEYPYFCFEGAIHIECVQEDFMLAIKYIKKLERKIKRLEEKTKKLNG